MKTNNCNFFSTKLSVLLMTAIILLSSCTLKAKQGVHTKNGQLISLNTQYYSLDTLTATTINSGFKKPDLTWNGVSTASNGKIYYVRSSHSKDKGGKVYVYNPNNSQSKFLGDLTEISGEAGNNTIPQGKVHTNFHELNDKLYFGTHVGYMVTTKGYETSSNKDLPKGYKPYPGGHIFSYDLNSGNFEDLAIAPKNQGIITFAMDKKRKQIYAITWPNAYFLHYDMNKDKIENLGKVLGNGEAGTPGKDYRVVVRSMFVEPKTGSVYFSNGEGDILTYKSGSNSISKVKGVSLKLDYIGKHNPTKSSDYGYNWRSIIWDSNNKVAYGVAGKSNYLFKFNPQKPSIELIERISSVPSRKSGMYDNGPYGHLGFKFGPNGNTIYYLTPGPTDISDFQLIKRNKKKEAKEVNHLITYNIANKKYIDHGPIYASNGSRIYGAQSIAITPKAIYTIARFERGGKKDADLVKIPNPLYGK